MVVTSSWSNVEDEVLKAAISKYGLNQWSRCASLLSKKSAKQCKSRWDSWLDPSIKKTEWSREDDEKLLTMAKLLPTQWRTIAPIVGRTATQCLERYQKLLDEQEARESGDLGLAGPEGGEAAAPSAEDVRRLRPGEVDAYAESRPARPDAIDMQEDDKEMLSEARARLANVSGKKAKRKARERQLEESRRLALLQKRRELKAAGINIKITPKKGNHIDYNADVPLEKEVPAGFFDTTEELDRNEKQREAFDPRKQQLANKRKMESQEDGGGDRKKKKDEKSGGLAASYAKAAQAQKIREAEQSSKRRALVLPSPQVGEAELEDIVKMGTTGQRAIMAGGGDNIATQGLIGNYTNIVGNTPIRTPMAPKEEDFVANEVRNARMRTETQSALLGGDNPDFVEDEAPASLSGPVSRHQIVTPNPMATPFRQANGGVGATPMRQGPGATPMRTPRDTLRLNGEDSSMQLVGQTPRDIKLREQAKRQDLKSRLAALPKPKEESWEFELPEEQAEDMEIEISEEDAAERDRRAREVREAQEAAEFGRQTQVVQKFLPRPSLVDIDAMMKRALDLSDPIEREIETEMAKLIANDVKNFGNGRVTGTTQRVEVMSDSALRSAKMEVALELGMTKDKDKRTFFSDLNTAWSTLHNTCTTMLPGIAGYTDDDDEIDQHQLLVQAFDQAQESIIDAAQRANKIEKRLATHHAGYMKRSALLRDKIGGAFAALERSRNDLVTARTALYSEEDAIAKRLASLRQEVQFVNKREREAQDLYRRRKEELESLSMPMEVNGIH
ncbi:REB1 Myb superfamily protein including transcription factors and mRNA splicing factors [Pyrenophora tritici-repentis]|uniref:Pre-mRNA-splicing factor cef1 n=2 Tax=Pyrenophora tritici-repentis TaxID=45151 RepID=A0A2W1E729_9PLEO|nr:pre-mRNA-splicing factor cef1 [Pyrenophora tritici-repentis Pt-1C-BFP]KAA8625386.1 Pre-mRNA-splicing factor cef1 [Pyrenophora tritici-repentis]EDU40197.1 pre-mRNA-splicing factor cef1 [Pyrenophora tritici-repentis Pt-1C-BFP]KAF7453785.1 Pre-mRNA-splicing factor cef1 [Pyrenophora tritici-repentis]KAF7576877.1 REB1, Myb superfamily protein [Pyrenophora tritici-repentis]KAG9387547.1 Pre-mRNA-splicing factor cef1 [Pyrenophora tritici-repentis]